MTYPHAVAQLRAQCKANSSRPFLARGSHIIRCTRCRIKQEYCICNLQPKAETDIGICLLMYDSEPFKPTNTGWLIADIIANTYAFRWSRVGNMQPIKDLINDPQWQPYVVFPKEYAPIARVTEEVEVVDMTKKPLFIILDATWTEARKIFRKSPYLDHLPVLSLTTLQHSQYQLRRSKNTEHLCTAEVAIECLSLAREVSAAKALSQWFHIFTEQYMKSKGS